MLRARRAAPRTSSGPEANLKIDKRACQPSWHRLPTTSAKCCNRTSESKAPLSGKRRRCTSSLDCPHPSLASELFVTFEELLWTSLTSFILRARDTSMKFSKLPFSTCVRGSVSRPVAVPVRTVPSRGGQASRLSPPQKNLRPSTNSVSSTNRFISSSTCYHTRLKATKTLKGTKLNGSPFNGYDGSRFTQ